MGSGASKKSWQRQFFLTSNVEDASGTQYSQVFPVWALAVSNNGLQLAAATSDLRINLWCLVTKVLLIPLEGHADTIWKVGYAPDDTILVSSSADCTVRLWEVAGGFPIMVLPRYHANWVWCLTFSPDMVRLATGGSDARVLIWDVYQMTEQAKMYNLTNDPRYQEASKMPPMLFWQAHEKSIHEMAFAKTDHKMLVTVGAEGTIAIWNAESGNLDARLCGHIGPILSVSISPLNEEIIATGGEDHTVRLWDIGDMEPGSRDAQKAREKAMGHNLGHFTLKGHEGGVCCVRFCSDGRLLASASKDCWVRLWNPDMHGPTLNHKFAAHEAWVRDLVWRSDQKYLFTGSTDGLIFGWQVPKKFHYKEPKKLKGNAKYAA